MAKGGGFPGGMPGNMNNLMKQAQKMQKQMEENQKALEEKEFTATAGGGAVEGKRVIMIDDSIVRGTTSDRIVRMLREAGAKEVHMRVSSPPFLHPCYFGTDVPEREQLIAHNRSVEEICRIIGADSLGYLRLERLSEMVDGLPVCRGCFTGEYPLDPPTEDIRGEYDR